MIIGKTRNDRGVALVITLLLLTLMSILGLAVVLASSSDMLINGYYRNLRGSFYAADSGLNVARQQLLTTVLNNVVTPFPTNGSSPIPIGGATGADTKAINSVNASYGSGYVPINTGNAAASWGASFEVVSNNACAPLNPQQNMFQIVQGYPTTQRDTQGNITSWTYVFNYSLCVVGRAMATQQVLVYEQGTLRFQPTPAAQVTYPSLAQFGGFVDHYPVCLGPLVPGTMEGPMFTNDAWEFMTGGAYIFTDPVGQANPDADYWFPSFGWPCIKSPTSSYTYKGQTIAPTFNGGFTLNQPTAPTPQDSFSQKWAVLDGLGCGESNGSVCGNPTTPLPNPPGLSDMVSHNMQTVNQTPYASGSPLVAATEGVFLPFTCSSGSCALNGNAGGFYVEGNASILLTPGTDAQGHPTQIYTITNTNASGGNPITTTITTNVGANTTTVSSGATTLVLTGVPTVSTQIDTPSSSCTKNLTGSACAATMVYVDGKITSLTGPGQGQPAIQDGAQITITAAGDVDITGDVIYKEEPVTLDTNDTYIPGNDHNQVLGVFTANGNVQLSSPYQNQNLQVDGSLAPVGPSNCPSCGFTVSGCINTFNNVGGQIQTNIYGACMNIENTWYDRRFADKQGFAPPWFPATTIIQGGPQPTNPNPSVQRLSWFTLPQSQYQTQ